MTSFQSEETPEFYRRRYEELKASAMAANARRAPAAAIGMGPIPAGQWIADEAIPPGWYWTTRLKRGQALRLTNTHATPGVSILLWNADDPSERFNHGDSVKLQWTARLGLGKLLMSDMGRVLACVTGDDSGLHDAILGGSTPQGDALRYGPGAWRNARDNFLLAAGKHGLGPRDIGSVMNFFAPVATDAQGRFGWMQDGLKPGARVDLRAEMNLLVAVSNTPHPLAPGPEYFSAPVQVTRWRAAQDEGCRTATEEAVRAFENTDAYFSE